VRDLVSTAMPGGILSVVAAMRRFSFHAGPRAAASRPAAAPPPAPLLLSLPRYVCRPPTTPCHSLPRARAVRHGGHKEALEFEHVRTRALCARARSMPNRLGVPSQRRPAPIARATRDAPTSGARFAAHASCIAANNAPGSGAAGGRTRGLTVHAEVMA
jgi:hypothetical protein